MFQNKHYLTRGVHASIPLVLQLYMWNLIRCMKVEQDYLQIFRLTIAEDGSQILQHSQENPHYAASYKLYILNPIHAKVYVINDGDHSTMLLAEEY